MGLNLIAKTYPIDIRKFGERGQKLLDDASKKYPDLYQLFLERSDRSSHEAMKEMLNSVNPKQPPLGERAQIIDITDKVSLSGAAKELL